MSKHTQQGGNRYCVRAMEDKEKYSILALTRKHDHPDWRWGESEIDAFGDEQEYTRMVIEDNQTGDPVGLFIYSGDHSNSGRTQILHYFLITNEVSQQEQKSIATFMGQSLMGLFSGGAQQVAVKIPRREYKTERLLEHTGLTISSKRNKKTIWTMESEDLGKVDKAKYRVHADNIDFEEALPPSFYKNNDGGLPEVDEFGIPMIPDSQEDDYPDDYEDRAMRLTQLRWELEHSTLLEWELHHEGSPIPDGFFEEKEQNFDKISLVHRGDINAYPSLPQAIHDLFKIPPTINATDLLDDLQKPTRITIPGYFTPDLAAADVARHFSAHPLERPNVDIRDDGPPEFYKGEYRLTVNWEEEKDGAVERLFRVDVFHEQHPDRNFTREEQYLKAPPEEVVSALRDISFYDGKPSELMEAIKAALNGLDRGNSR